MQIKPRVDSRSKQFSFAQYGQTVFFEDEYNVDSPIPDAIQPSGDVKCTCYSICGVLEDKENRSFDIGELFKRIPSNKNGADPITSIKEARDRGVCSMTSCTHEKLYTAFFEAHTSTVLDAFDSVRSSLVFCKYSVMAWGCWYRMWGFSSILQTETNFNSYHAITIKGWTQKYGEPMFIIDAHVGRPMYMKRSVFNAWAKTWGFGSAVLATREIYNAKEKTLYEMLLDLMQNLYIELKFKKTVVGKVPSLYEIGYKLIGKHLTLDNSVDKSVGCAQATSYVLKQYGALIPNHGISGTIDLNKWLSKNATEIKNSEPGCIIISVTGSGSGKIRGHVGIVGYKSIMSNDSESGLWLCEWTIQDWLDYYTTYGNLLTKFYKI